MDYLWIFLGGAFILVGIIGSIIPIIPGPPLSYIALLFLQFKEESPFTLNFMLVMAVITIAVTIIDYVIPAWGTKKTGGSKAGIWGATIGMVLGIFIFPPIGLIIGPFIGAFVGELLIGKDSNAAFKSGLGSFFGFVTGTMLKLVVSVVIGYYFIINAF